MEPLQLPIDDGRSGKSSEQVMRDQATNTAITHVHLETLVEHLGRPILWIDVFLRSAAYQCTPIKSM